MDLLGSKLKGFVRKGNFKLSSGKKSDFYIDIKEACTYPPISKNIGKKFSTIINKVSRKKKIDNVAGIELGSISLAAVASVYSGKKFLMIRKSKKNYGTSNPIEGEYKKGETVMIIDDVLTSGKSVIKAKRALKNAGLKPLVVAVVVDRDEGGRKLLERENLDLYALYTRRDLLE